MVPTAARTFIPTTHLTMTSNANTTNNNNVYTPTACNSGSIASNFGVHQQTLIGTSYVSIHTLITDAISAKPYRNALIVKIFFR